ncbi:hypothetical protein GE21DRAFT_1307867 [Neurospora crassa]|nr:hypothetical protein B8B20.90 [imported] - Neurospora crassa [Neurospora crassa]KHE85253.1 hypothetical protein GE21DRAFT_1307867 [Neurospora crassa]
MESCNYWWPNTDRPGTEDSQETKASPEVEKDEAFDFNQERNANCIVPTEERGVLEVKKNMFWLGVILSSPDEPRSSVLFILSYDIDMFPSMSFKEKENIAVYHTV